MKSALASCQIKDDFSNCVSLQHPPNRIVSLAPDITEILFAVGAGNQVVAISEKCDYPEQTKNIPIVSNHHSLDIEKILRLKPDLIIAWGVGLPALSTLTERGIPVYHNDPHTLHDVSRSIRRLGYLTGRVAKANQLADHFELQLKLLAQQYHRNEPWRVFYQLGSYPSFTINHTSWIDEAITICGGENIFHHALVAVPRVNWEMILRADPEVVVSDVDFRYKKIWREWPQIAAVKKHRLYSIEPSYLERASPRLILGIENLCKMMRD